VSAGLDTYKTSLRLLASGGLLTPANLRTCWGVARFCGTYGVQPATPDDAVSLFGYGVAQPVFIPDPDVERSEWWVNLDDLPAATGIPREKLLHAWYQEREEACLTHEAGWKTQADQLVIADEDGTYAVRLWSSIGVMGLFMGLSPWSEEFSTTMEPTLRRAALASGITDVDSLLADGPLPSARESRRQIEAGPAAVIDDLRGGDRD
jgi:hypothetical protein